jgi:hypothetical protein
MMVVGYCYDRIPSQVIICSILIQSTPLKYAPFAKGQGIQEAGYVKPAGEVARFWLHSRQETVLSAVERDIWAPKSAEPAEEAVGHCFEEVH